MREAGLIMVKLAKQREEENLRKREEDWWEEARDLKHRVEEEKWMEEYKN